MVRQPSVVSVVEEEERERNGNRHLLIVIDTLQYHFDTDNSKYHKNLNNLLQVMVICNISHNAHTHTHISCTYNIMCSICVDDLLAGSVVVHMKCYEEEDKCTVCTYVMTL